jgi:hypothetical protein
MVSDIPAGDVKYYKLFLLCVIIVYLLYNRHRSTEQVLGVIRGLQAKSLRRTL